jgi:uncharacterized protein (TIGR01319 family)
MVRSATPDAVLAGVEVLADGAHDVPGAGDVLVVDVGGATTDVYSVITPQGEDATVRREVVATVWRARTVEGDLGMRWNAPGIVRAARAERLLTDHDDDLDAVWGGEPGGGLEQYAALAAANPGWLPDDPRADVRLAELAVTIALRRHGRPTTPSAAPRPLADIRLVVGSGGVLRHHDGVVRARILAPARQDHGGGWRVPDEPRLTVDDRYVLFAAGLLAPTYPRAAALLARSALTHVPAPR